MKQSTEILATGVILGKEVTLIWTKGEEISIKEGGDKLLEEIIQLKIEELEILKCSELFVIANNYHVKRKSALWAYIIFNNIFDKLINIEMNGKVPTIPYKPGVIY